MAVLHKIQSGVYPPYLRDLIPVATEPQYSLRSVSRIPFIACRLSTTYNSFIPSTIRMWNNLPQNVVDAQSSSHFKNLLQGHSVRNIYNTLCTGRPGIWLSRMRMGLSALGQHRFNYNLIENACCPNCGDAETTFHYFFVCRSYSHQRTVMYNALADQNHDINNKNNLLNIILFGNTPNKVDLLEVIYTYMRTTQRFK